MPKDADVQFRLSAVIPEFQDARRAASLSNLLLAQALPSNVSLEIIIIDDGSEDGSVEHLSSTLPNQVQLLALRPNRGRSAARQAGIDTAKGDAILFIDCDCEPSSSDFIASHVRQIQNGAVASTGPVFGFDGGFWDHYQRAASQNRKMQHARGNPFAGSTQNMLVSAKALTAVGGFDIRYRGYGFEDRDLLIRLAKLGRVSWCEEATVRHLDEISMTSVSSKMYAAGKENSRLFATEHPAAYKALHYASIDACEHGWLRLPATAIEPALRPAALAFDALLRRGVLPWMLAFIMARGLSAASFLAGTARAKSR